MFYLFFFNVIVKSNISKTNITIIQKNARFLNEHVAYLRSFTQWRSEKPQTFDGYKLYNI